MAQPQQDLGGEQSSPVKAESDRLSRQLDVWVEVLESCLPTDEGYDDDTEQVLGNVIFSMRRLVAERAADSQAATHTSGSAADPSVESLTAELVGVREQLRQAEEREFWRKEKELGARQKPREDGESEGLDRASGRQVARAAIRVVLRHLGTEGEREVEAEIAKVVQQEANRG